MPHFELTRTLPEGQVKQWKVEFRTLRAACVAAAHCLHDNRAADKADAQRFGKALAAAPLGEFFPHSSGYGFKVDRVTASRAGDPS